MEYQLHEQVNVQSTGKKTRPRMKLMQTSVRGTPSKGKANWQGVVLYFNSHYADVREVVLYQDRELVSGEGVGVCAGRGTKIIVQHVQDTSFRL